MLKVTGRGRFNADVRRWIGRVRGGAEIAARNIAESAMQNAVQHSPQYSGQFAASWNLSVGAPNYASVQPASQIVDGQVLPYEEGSNPAVAMAMSRSASALVGFRLGQTIYLSNSVEHDEPYSLLIEQGRIRFRDENPSEGATLARAFEHVQRRYAVIGRMEIAELTGVQI